MGRGLSNDLKPASMRAHALPVRCHASVMAMPDILAIDVRQIRTDALAGKLSIKQLLDIIDKQQLAFQRLETKTKRLIERLAQYEPEIRDEIGDRSAAAEPKPAVSYSLNAETRRRRPRRRKKKSPGRRPTKQKFADAEHYQDIYPDGVRRADCKLVRQRAVWRLENGRAVHVGYRIFAGPDGTEPRIPGVTPRCEYGIEILVVLAFLVYIIGMSLDKACAVLGFFCQLPLAKSQADALLRQLARHWKRDFDFLCNLIAHAAVVYLDDTGWKIGSQSCSLWAIASKLERLFYFGCRKDDDTLDRLLPPDVFDGIGVSDDAHVFRGRFRRSQKCWAHLLRKAIRLALLYPRVKRFQRFLDRLLELYYSAKRFAKDKRLGQAGREQRIVELEDRLCKLCAPYQWLDRRGMKRRDRDFSKLVDELLRLLLAEELFTFVLEPDVESTNNSSERRLRGPAQDRKAGRTNKTASGAHRRSVILSVLESLRANLQEFNLKTVLVEVGRWMSEGISVFGRRWHALNGRPQAATDTS
jgi:transposase